MITNTKLQCTSNDLVCFQGPRAGGRRGGIAHIPDTDHGQTQHTTGHGRIGTLDWLDTMCLSSGQF